MGKIKTKKVVKIFLLVCFVSLSFGIVSSAFAVSLVPCGTSENPQPCTLCHLVIGFKTIYDYLFELLLVATTVVIVVAGIMYMVSSGDKGMIEKAKTAFMYALTAIILALVAWLIINTTLHALGYKSVGNWWTFTCDTTQTQGPTGGTGTGTLPGTGGGNLTSPKSGQDIVDNAKKMLGWTYTQNSLRTSDGYGDCSSVADRAAGRDPTLDTKTLYSQAAPLDSQSSLQPGDQVVYRYIGNSGTEVGHIVTCVTPGCSEIIHASESKGAVVEGNGSWIFDGRYSNLRVIKAAS